ncbi:pyruvate kinase [Elusimicrobiota bacterium]
MELDEYVKDTAKMKSSPKTKIICTIGPSSSNTSVLRKMMVAGMDAIRLNFSHGTHEEHLKVIELVREINKKYRRRIRILGDLRGYRIRVGKLINNKPIELKKRQIIHLTTKDIAGKGKIIPFDYQGSLQDIKKGQHIFIDDGNIALKVESHEKQSLRTRVLIPGLIKPRKGINIPDAKLKFKGITDKDRNDIDFCIENKIDFLAQSFVRNKNDVLALKDYIGDRFKSLKLVAKIENNEGIRNIDEIIKTCEGILIARGDMGISIPIYKVPLVQKSIIKKCNKAKKIAFTATQMLESMTENHLPTRAEVSDVANAILDGTDYVMLSAETAVGKYPVQCVDMMNKIARYTENNK